ncbi:hypothetical protein [Tabrizicola aquatica]|uniref:hypothetical protein n=1 Tax=Tabrizicola aquatica TaxID=909926 RepID=UPI0011AFD19A|nr:hypothetical protein [Tabrizicola aquatica]
MTAISRSAFGRWGGRRSPIIPATRDGVEEVYSKWLEVYDPDVVYSYVDLTDAAILDFHERFTPGDLVLHYLAGSAEDWRRLRVSLPLEPLHSVSVIPMVKRHLQSRIDPIDKLFIVDRFWDKSHSEFIENNFGFISDTSSNVQIGRIEPTLFSCKTLISKASLENRSSAKSRNADYITSETELLEEIASNRSILSVSLLSDAFAHYVRPKDPLQDQGVTVFVGDTFDDRVSAWNVISKYDRPRTGEICTIYLSQQQSKDDNLLAAVWRLIDNKGVRDHQHGPYASIASCSLPLDDLKEIASRLVPKDQPYKRVACRVVPSGAAVVPDFHENSHYFTTGIFNEPVQTLSWEYDGNRSSVPLIRPWHVSEGQGPTSVSAGNWMVDFTIDRAEDHSPYANVNHHWHLPRRLRIDRFFHIERTWRSGFGLSNFVTSRVNSNGQLSLSLCSNLQSLTLDCPSDERAIRGALTSQFEWPAPKQGGPTRRQRFTDVRYSDKGRYFLGLIHQFQGVNEAVDVLLNSFWSKVFRELGADSAVNDPALVERLTATLRKKFGQGDWNISSGAGHEDVARKSIQAASTIRRGRRFLKFSDLRQRWQATVEANAENLGEMKPDLEAEIVRSISFLCQRKVLFQGVDWKCSYCYHDNWTSITSLDSVLGCEVCGRTRAAMVDGEWHFVLNKVLTNAYGSHGAEPVVYALGYLLKQWNVKSFYFVPAIKLWTSGYSEDRSNDCEIDLLAIVNGEVVAVEATTASSLSPQEVGKLAMFAERARPDKVLVVCGAASKRQLDSIQSSLEAALPLGVDCEVVKLSKTPELIHGLPH